MKTISQSLVCICLALSWNMRAQTSIAGGTVNGVWTLSGSPYNVAGSILVNGSDSLIIQPGVTVNMGSQCKILVFGKIKAIGNASDTIRFNASNVGNGWRGIRFDNTNPSADSSVLAWCKF